MGRYNDIFNKGEIEKPDILNLNEESDMHGKLYKSKVLHKYCKLPIKWSFQLGQKIWNHIIHHSLQELQFEFVEDYTLKTELYRFKEVLLWYDENIKVKYMESGEILKSCLLQGPAFADYLSDTLKYSLRKTLGLRLEDALRDYPVIEERIDYIFDPKCLIEWDATEPDDYLYLFKEPKEIDLEFVQQVLRLMPVIPMVKPDILDYLKLYRKSKVFDSKKLKSIFTFKDTISNPKWKTPHCLRFKRAVAHKYPDEKRDILICDHDTLKVILEASFYLRQILEGMKEYKKNRAKVYAALKRHNGKMIYLMTDLKKSGLSISRVLVRQTLLRLYDMYGIEVFKTLYDGFDSMLIYVNNEWKMTTEGKGLGLLDEIVSITMILLFRYAKEAGELPEQIKGWFFNDDQLLYFQEEDMLDFNLILEYWNEFIRKFGFTVHSDKPWVSKVGQFCEVYSPRSPIDTEKSLRQYHIMVSNIRLPIFEAKTAFSLNYGRWWGLNPDDFERSFRFVTSYFGYEFKEEEQFYPVEFGGWKSIRKNKINYALCEACDNWETIDTRFLNLLKIDNLKLVTKWWKSSLRKFQRLVPNTVDDDGIFSLKKRFEQLMESLKLPTKFEYKYKYMYYDQMILRRQDTVFKGKRMSKSDFLKLINSKTWNNFAIPLEFGEVGNDLLPPVIPFVYQFITETDDVTRLYNTFLGENQVRKPLKGDETSLFKYLYLLEEDPEYNCKPLYPGMYKLKEKLCRFGGMIRSLYEDFYQRFLSRHKEPPIGICSDPIKHIEISTVSLNTTKSYIQLCFEGNIFDIDLDLFPGWDYHFQEKDYYNINKGIIVEAINRKFNTYEGLLILNTFIESSKGINNTFINDDLIVFKQPEMTDGMTGADDSKKSYDDGFMNISKIFKKEDNEEEPDIFGIQVDPEEWQEQVNYLNYQAVGWFNNYLPTTGLVVENYNRQQENIDLTSELPELEDDPFGNLF